MTLIDHVPQYAGPTPGLKPVTKGSRRCLICLKVKARNAFRVHSSTICTVCSNKQRKESDARWNSKSEAEHAADGNALFASMARRRAV